MSEHKPRNSRSSCCDCLKPCMTIRPTENTPLLRAAPNVPFCTECVKFWERVPRPGKDRDTWKCLECKDVMPIFMDSFGSEGIDWAHKETCEAIFQPCECKIRNKVNGQQRCRPCSKPVREAISKQNKETSEVLRSMSRRPNPGGRGIDGPEPSPWGENAVRALEGD